MAEWQGWRGNLWSDPLGDEVPDPKSGRSENENCVKRAEVAAEERLSPIYFIGDDVAYKGALMFSPRFLRKTFIKCLRRTAEPLKNAGIKVIFHSDGYVMGILDDMIDAGIDGLNPIEPIAGMDIGYLKRR